MIAVTELALKQIVELGHKLKSQVILVTDNGPAMKSRRFKIFVKKTEQHAARDIKQKREGLRGHH